MHIEKKRKKMKKLPKNFNIKLTLYNEDYSFGMGMYRLLKMIEEKRSINSACKEMKMAYSKAYKMIQKSEHDLGYKLLVGKTGGSGGGGSTLTKEAYRLMEFYEKLLMEIKEFTNEKMKELK